MMNNVLNFYKILIVVVVQLFIITPGFAQTPVSDHSFTSPTNVWYVPDDFPTIQQAIDAAQPYDSIYIRNGIYYERIILSKPLTIFGEREQTTVIDAMNLGNVITVASNEVTISHVTLKNAAAWPNSGIYGFSTKNLLISNISITNTQFGIWLEYSADHNKILNTTFSSNIYRDIFIFGSMNNTISHNSILSNCEDGIYLRACHQTIITYNTIANHTKNGILLEFKTTTSLITQNTITKNNYGIRLAESTNNTISHNQIYANQGTSGIGFMINAGSHNNSITNNLFSANKGTALSIDQSNKILITGNQFTNNLDGVVLTNACNISLCSNTFTNDGLAVLNSEKNIVQSNYVNEKPLVYLERTENVTIDMKDSAGQVVLISCRNISVKNQNLSNTSIGIEIWNSTNCDIKNNVLLNNGFGVYSRLSQHNHICNNVISKSYWDGIGLLYSHRNIVAYNTVTNSTRHGLYLLKSCNHTINRNTLSFNQYQGVFLQTSNHNILTNCTITYNTGGMYILLSSSYNVLKNNKITANFIDGVWVSHGSNNNIFSYNNISNNLRRGITLSMQSTYNTLHHNTFMNDDNSYDTEPTQWDDGTYGNYWSDYTGIDENNDGVGDTPYTVPGRNNQDRYPLMHPPQPEQEPDELVADAHGPYTGFLYEHIQFTGSATGGVPPYSYSWNFGDGTVSMEQNPIHSYNTEGRYTITFTVTDQHGTVAQNTTTATIRQKPCEIQITNIRGGFGIIATVKNIGTTAQENIPWSIQLRGGIILMNKDVQGTISSLDPGHELQIKSGLILGLGKPTITITAGCTTEKRLGTLLFCFIRNIQ
ncbi:MAG: NosD domain-containing protein [Candidatus Thermoplasmatota archaeon]